VCALCNLVCVRVLLYKRERERERKCECMEFCEFACGVFVSTHLLRKWRVVELMLWVLMLAVRWADVKADGWADGWVGGWVVDLVVLRVEN